VLEERFAGNERGWPHDPQGTAWLPALLPAGVGGAAAGSAEAGYRMHARTPGQFVAVGVPTLGVVRDVLVTATFRKVGGPAGGGYGLILRDQGPFPRDGRSQTGRYYVLEVGDRGEFGIWRRENDRWVDIVPWTASPAVRPGNAPNELAVLATGDRLTFAVNGTPISAADATLPPGGLGVFTGGDGNDVLLLRLAVQTPQ
jgi:hypothetical protein